MIVSSSLLLLLLILLAGWGYGDSGKKRELKGTLSGDKSDSSSFKDDKLSELLDAELLQGVENFVGDLRKQHQRILQEKEMDASRHSLKSSSSSSSSSRSSSSRSSSSSSSNRRKLVRATLKSSREYFPPGAFQKLFPAVESLSKDDALNRCFSLKITMQYIFAILISFLLTLPLFSNQSPFLLSFRLHQ